MESLTGDQITRERRKPRNTSIHTRNGYQTVAGASSARDSDSEGGRGNREIDLDHVPDSLRRTGPRGLLDRLRQVLGP